MRRRGFTLVELLIAIVLMMILLSSITMIFVKTTETVNLTEARMQVYTNARYAFDILENDLMGCLPFSGQQKFVMDNGNAGSPGADPTYNAGGSHVGNATDRIIFRSTTTVADTLQTVEVEWCLIPGSKALTTYATNGLPGTNVQTGDPSYGQTVGASGSPRPLYTLVRRVRAADANGIYTMPPSDGGTPPSQVPDMEMCRFVISFNVEYFANNQQFSQLEPSPCPSNSSYGGPSGTDPLGNGEKANDGKDGGTALRVPYIRVTLVIVEDVYERQERSMTKTFTIPMG